MNVGPGCSAPDLPDNPGHRGTREAWDNVKMNRSFDAFLRERGYQPTGGEGHEGFGWVSWRNRTDRLFSALFPKSR